MVAEEATSEELRVQAEESLLRLLGRREHSQFELRQKLRQRGFPNDIIQALLVKAESNGWQSDERYTEIWLRQQLATGNGPLKIKAKAASKGIGSELLDHALMQAEPDWVAIGFEQLCKRFGEAPAAQRSEREKRMRYLQGRGFNFDHVKQILAQQNASDDAHSY